MPLDNRQLLCREGLRDLLVLDLAVDRDFVSAATAAEIVLWNLVREPGTPSVIVEQLVAEASLDTQTLLGLETEADRLILFAGDRSLADLGPFIFCTRLKVSTSFSTS